MYKLMLKTERRIQGIENHFTDIYHLIVDSDRCI
jgi:hypothetical protein